MLILSLFPRSERTENMLTKNSSSFETDTGTCLVTKQVPVHLDLVAVNLYPTRQQVTTMLSLRLYQLLTTA